MIVVDGLGKLCPIPVIETKKALDNSSTDETILIKVDNYTAVENLTKLVEQLGMKKGFNINKLSDNLYEVTVVKGQGNKTIDNINTSSTVIAISSDTMGKGEEELGKKLLEGFIYSLTELKELPKYILFFNKGVYNTTDNKKTCEDLLILQKKGVNILSCGLCLDYYNLKENLQVGEVTNMYTIADILTSNGNVINI